MCGITRTSAIFHHCITFKDNNRALQYFSLGLVCSRSENPFAIIESTVLKTRWFLSTRSDCKAIERSLQRGQPVAAEHGHRLPYSGENGYFKRKGCGGIRLLRQQLRTTRQQRGHQHISPLSNSSIRPPLLRVEEYYTVPRNAKRLKSS